MDEQNKQKQDEFRKMLAHGSVALLKLGATWGGIYLLLGLLGSCSQQSIAGGFFSAVWQVAVG